MSLNGSTPVSAFEVYKKRPGNKVKNKVDSSPAKKKKLTVRKMTNKSSDKIKTIKHNGIEKNKKKKKTEKKKYLNGENNSGEQNVLQPFVNLDDDDEQPPLLVPIEIKNSSENEDVQGAKKPKTIKNKKIKSSQSNEEMSMSEYIAEMHKTDPLPEGLKLFKWLIAPVTPKTFFETYWESDTLYIGRDKDTYYSHLLTTHKLDGIFREFPLYYTRNVDVVSYENGVKTVHNEEGRVVASALYDYYSNGCSIRVLNPQTYDQKIHLLIATLQEYFGTMVGTNVYLTPPGSQGFAPHYDDIEAFILQLEGRKHWKLYRPKGSDVLARYSSPNLKHEDIGDPIAEVTLKAGDLLYFPRGTIHEGRTDPDAHSLHVTVSVYQHTSYVDLLEQALPKALKKAANEDIDYRKGLPVNYLKHVGWVNKGNFSDERYVIKRTVEKLLQNLSQYVDIDGAADQLGKKFMYDSMPPVLSKREVLNTSKQDGDYMKDGKVFNRVEIGMDTEVRLLRYHCLRLVIEEDNPKIYYNVDNAKVYHGEEEQVLIIDHQLIPAIQKLQNSYPNYIMVEDLPVEDNIAKAQLVSDLWEKGLLVTNGPLPSFSEEESDEEESESD